MFRVKPEEIKDLSSNPPARVHKYKTAAVIGSSTEDKMCQSSGVPLLLPPRIPGSARGSVSLAAPTGQRGWSLCSGTQVSESSDCDSRAWQLSPHTAPVLLWGTLKRRCCAVESGFPGERSRHCCSGLSRWDSWLLLQLHNGFS